MRWERLFEDLEAQLAAEASRERDAEVADRTRRERALLGLHERLTAAVGAAPVAIVVAGAGLVSGGAVRVGPDWVLVEEASEREVLVPFGAIRALTGLGGAQTTGAVAKGFGLGAVLRAVSRDRAAVELVDVGGGRFAGTIDAVGQDAFDVAEHPLDVPRRSRHVLATRTVPFHALALVRRR